MPPLAIDEVGRVSRQILDEIERVVIGKRRVLELVLIAVLADGHVLLEDYPGLAKTLIARSFASVSRLDFKRIQFTPDLMPSDVTGSSLTTSGMATSSFGPGRSSPTSLLADEINRAPPRRKPRCSRQCRSGR